MEATIQIKNNIKELETLNIKLEEIGESWNIPHNIIMNINLALEEIITNIIYYAFEDKSEHIIDIKIALEKNSLNIKIADRGKPFNLLEMPKPDDLNKNIAERKIGGLGIYFVRNLMDKINYSRNDGKNILYLTKNISSEFLTL